MPRATRRIPLRLIATFAVLTLAVTMPATRPATASARAVTDGIATPLISIAAVGDVTLGRAETGYPAGGAMQLLRGARRWLRGDLVLGNLETTLTDPRQVGLAPKCTASAPNCFMFGAPPAFALQLRRSGFTALNVANNHWNDYGAAGRQSTVDALRRAGLVWTGAPGRIALIGTRGARVAVLGFAPYRWAQNLLDIPAARRLVRAAQRVADLVVVTMHAGAEGSDRDHVIAGTESYLGEDRGDVRRFAHAAVDAGADLVVGHGPHVLRGLEWYHERLIAYSLGNFSSWGTLSTAGALGTTAILQATLDTAGRVRAGRLVAMKLAGGAPVAEPVGRAVSVVRALSRADFGPHAVRLNRAGTIAPPSSSSG